MDNLSYGQTADDATAGEAFEHFRTAPVASWRDLTLGEPILVIAPHADDETLGCGGLIAESARKGIGISVAVMTDGSRSHPNSKTHNSAAIRDLREKEVRAALDALGAFDAEILFLRRSDGYLASEGDDAERCADVLADLIERQGIGTMFVTWGDDPHPDHKAAYQISRLVAARRPATRHFAYPIWGLTLAADERLTTPSKPALRYEIRLTKARKLAAIECFDTQLGGVIDDDPDAFRLSDEDIERFSQDFETFIDLRSSDAEISSVPTEHFDNLYRQNADPWNYVANNYEQDRFSATVAALPKPHYRRGLEIGCSIGVLTEKLAAYCDQMLGIDCSSLALEQAHRRLERLPNAEAALMRAPDEMPDGSFDLIVLSEVLYFFSEKDLRTVQAFVASRLDNDGTCILVNFLGDTESPKTGAEAADRFIQLSEFALRSVTQQEFDGFRIDVLRKP